MKRTITLFVLGLCLSATGQEKKEEVRTGIQFSGFVKSDFFFDSRENYTIREGHFLLYPREENPDANGKDLNDQSSFNFLSIQTRLTAKITGPDAFGAKTSGVIEADFFGNENAAFVDANGFRLRHAFVKLTWEKTELLAGQYWHPLFIPGCFSGVVSFNTGAPMQPFSRNPQARFSYKAGPVQITAVASGQRDFTSPQGSASLRYASVPELTGLLSYEMKETGRELLVGGAASYKTLKPRLSTSKPSGATFASDEKVSGLSLTGFLKYKAPGYTWKIQGILGQNLFDLTMLGGYAVHSVLDTATNRVDYTPLETLSLWTELHSNGTEVQVGIWAGFIKNQGATESILAYSNLVDGTDVTIRGANLDQVFRVSPRILFISGKFQFATELELTQAFFATRDDNGVLKRDEFGKITESKAVTNIRLLLAAIYYF